MSILLKKREFKFILPMADNNGNSLSQVHKAVQNQLVTTFGGYSMHYQVGAWLDDEDNEMFDKSIVYTVAIAKEQEIVLMYMIRMFGVMAKQDAIYSTDAAGYVNIVDLVRWRDPDNWQEKANKALAERRQANRPW